ncbi:MAG TPA: tetratricopeptide repeat-containing serine protease family protein [Leptolyngbya sp.]|jgi:regulator of sirC expression with transglutaminase-like and TPR domain|nr:tetratricopeptide repeat-containing serine protease family protein [Leptolyngbya sp.]
MKLPSKTATVLNTLTIALGFTPVAFALDPAAIYQQSSPAVVSITVPNGKSFAYGSGFIANSGGWILTNQHVVGKEQQVKVKLADGSVYPGIVVARSSQTDLALIQIRPKKRLPSLTFQNVPPKTGQKVYAIGDPNGLERSLSDGIVSRIDPSGQIQYTATVSFGSSGGPLLDEDGLVIGVVRAGYPGTNLNFAIPVAAAHRLLKPQGLAAQQRQQIESYLLAGNLQMRQGNYQKGIAILTEGIRRYPNVAALYTNRGAVKGVLGDYRGELSDYTRSIQLEPSSLAYSNQAILYSRLKQPQQALKALTEAINLNREWGEGNLGEAFYDRGRIYAQLNNPKAAISDFKQAARFFSQRGNDRRYQAALDQITLLMAQ